MSETICAISTLLGSSAIGVIRISGKLVERILKDLVGFCPANRVATICTVRIKKNLLIDYCLVFFFRAPNSFTGEDLAELHCHGNERILTVILDFIISIGARLAFPGEFSFRALLNKKINLLQVKAILKLLKTSRLTSFNVLTRILKLKKNKLVKNFSFFFNAVVIKYEFYCEFNLVFTFFQRELFFFYFYLLLFYLNSIIVFFRKFFYSYCLKKVFFLGQPNVGKSSIMNFMSGRKTSIVSTFPGTTRDFIKETIIIDQKSLFLFDTAGFKIGLCDRVEKIGISLITRRVKFSEVSVVLILDISLQSSFISNRFFSEFFYFYPFLDSFIIVINKVDVYNQCSFFLQTFFCSLIFISVKKRDGSVFLLKYFKNFLLDKKSMKVLTNNMLSLLLDISFSMDLSLYFFIKGKYGKSRSLLNKCFKNFNNVFYLHSKEILDKIFSQFCVGK